MGPDEEFPTIAEAGQVFFAPVGTELPGLSTKEKRNERY